MHRNGNNNITAIAKLPNKKEYNKLHNRNDQVLYPDKGISINFDRLRLVYWLQIFLINTSFIPQLGTSGGTSSRLGTSITQVLLEGARSLNPFRPVTTRFLRETVHDVASNKPMQVRSNREALEAGARFPLAGCRVLFSASWRPARWFRSQPCWPCPRQRHCGWCSSREGRSCCGCVANDGMRCWLRWAVQSSRQRSSRSWRRELLSGGWPVRPPEQISPSVRSAGRNCWPPSRCFPTAVHRDLKFQTHKQF